MKIDSLKCLDVVVKLHLNPFFLQDIEKGVNTTLQRYLFRWISNFSGVLIGWKDVKIKKDIAFLKGDVSPYIDVPVALKILLFAPKKGELLKGKVISKGYDHIALRVMSLWNSAIAKSRIPDSFDWSVVEDGMMIQFRVSNLHITNNLLSIQGSFEGDNVGIVDENGDVALPVIEKKKKKKRSRETTAETDIETSSEKRVKV